MISDSEQPNAHPGSPLVPQNRQPDSPWLQRELAADVLPSSRWLILALFLVAVVANYFVYSVLAPLADLLRDERGFSDARIGALSAWTGAPGIVMAFVAGVAVDRLGASRAALLFAGVATIGSVVCATALSFGGLALGRAIFGCGGQPLLIAVTAAAACLFPAGQLGLSQGLVTASAAAAAVAADTSPAWIPVAYEMGTQAVFVLAATGSAFGLIAVGGAWALWKRQVPSPSLIESAGQDRDQSLTKLGLPREFWLLTGLCVALTCVFEPYCSTFAVKYLQDAHGLSRPDAGLANGAVFLGLIVLAPILGRAFDLPKRRSLGLVLGALILLPTFVVLRAMPGEPGVGIALLTLSYSLLTSIVWPAVAVVVEPRRVGIAYGVLSSLLCLGVVIAAPAVGALNTALAAGPTNPKGYDGMLLVFGAFSVCVLAAAIALRRSLPEGLLLRLPRTESYR